MKTWVLGLALALGTLGGCGSAAGGRSMGKTMDQSEPAQQVTFKCSNCGKTVTQPAGGHTPDCCGTLMHVQ